MSARYLLRSALAAALLVCPIPLLANTTTDALISYNPGDESQGISAYQNGGAPAVGLPARINAANDLTNVTPYTPAYDPGFLTLINAGGQITLHFAQTVSANTGAQIGIFSSIGLVASPDSSGSNVITSTGPATFSDTPNAAIISVSDTGLPGSFIPLNNGNPLLLNLPTNAYLDSSLAYNSQFQFVNAQNGSAPADFFKPFTPTNGLSSFSDLSYAQILALLDGSAGGNWINLSGPDLPANINYIQLSVPTGDQLLLDGITATPEPTTLTLLSLSSLLLLKKNRRRTH
ncbi:MAG TPA: hypothetical protein VH253_04435 [Phycisphaerae bacterium]|nr:hypothetical protein [Phycisphaerae bacterium]